MQSTLQYLREAETRNAWDPNAQFDHARRAVKALVCEHITIFGSAGKA